MATTIYHNPRCSTSRKVLGWIRESGVEPAIVEYLKTPLSAAQLRDLLGKLGLRPRDILRRKEPAFAALGFGNAALDDAAIIDAIVREPVLLERPIVVSDRGARLCRPPERAFEVIDRPA